jgi:Carboxypeptidase regulatory-like domain
MAALPVSAQSIFGTIVGTVTDASSAVVSGARVTVVNAKTNEKRQFVTDEKGSYEINNLFPGIYMLEVEMAGFARHGEQQIELTSNQSARVDIKLEVAGQVTQVAVRSEGITPIETESAKLSDARNLQQLQTLPLGARSVYRFLVLTPGVTGGMNGTMSVSGSGLRQVHFAVDGVTMSDVRTSNTIGPTLNFMEAFEEIKIDFGNNSAEFKGVGTLDITTKRGGNDMHGSVYDYYGTGAFLARDYFTHARSGTPTHGFGGNINGPAYLPKLYNGKNKTFWFASYETTFAPQGVSQLTPSVPLAVWKQGDFSGQSIAIKDPLANGAPFANNVIPQARINNVAKLYLPFWPDPNFGNPTVFANQNFRQQGRVDFAKPHNFQTRVDHRISEKNTIFGRYLHQRQQNPDFESGLPGTLGFHQQLRVVKHMLVSDTHIFSSSLINEARFGISFNTNPQSAKDINGPDFIKRAGFINVTRDGIIPDVHEIPVVTFAQGPGIQAIQVTNQREFNEDLTYQWQDTISKITGKHSLRFGAEGESRS